MLAVVFATEEEATPFLQRYARGRLAGVTEGEAVTDGKVLVALTGTGKIKATLRTERLLAEYQPDALLHVGAALALRDEPAVEAVIAAEQVLEGDRIELAAPTYPRMPLATPFEDELDGITLVTQDHLEADAEGYWQRLAAATDATAYAVAYVAAMHGTPCYVAKVITGRVGQEDEHLRKTRRHAFEGLASFLLDTALPQLLDDEE